jgi:hypothetical protein
MDGVPSMAERTAVCARHKECNRSQSECMPLFHTPRKFVFEIQERPKLLLWLQNSLTTLDQKE